MTPLRRAVGAVGWLAISLWLAALIAAGVAAMSVFGELPKTDLTLTDYANFPHSEHGRLAAGMVMDRVFSLTDRIQWVAVPIAIVCLIAQLTWTRRKSVLRVIALIAMIVGGSLFGWYAIRLAPPMNAHLVAFRNAAQNGDSAEASRQRAAFDVLHPQADTLLRINLVLVSIAILATGAATIASDSGRGHKTSEQG